MKLHPITAIVLALSLALASCGSSSDDSATQESASQDSATDEPAAQDPETDEPATPDPPTEDPATDGEELFPDVLAASASQDGDGTWTFEATLSSPYDSADRYADAWRVVGPDGTVYGIRELAHDHASEQPFTRSQSGIGIPDEVDVVTVEGRDQVSGWGGATVEVTLP